MTALVRVPSSPSRTGRWRQEGTFGRGFHIEESFAISGLVTYPARHQQLFKFFLPKVIFGLTQIAIEIEYIEPKLFHHAV